MSKVCYRSCPVLIAPLRRFARVATFLFVSATANQAEPQTSRIVGLGATTCMRFSADVQNTPAIQRDYLAWAQGYMSGLLITRPSGVDETLNLVPAAFDLIQQLAFLKTHCAQNPSQDFSDAVQTLYKRLRLEVSK
jgi:hypothetical protein